MHDSQSIRVRPILLLLLAMASGGEAAQPDPGCRTLEDFYGDTGDRFQAAIGLISVEGTSSGLPVPSYGLGVDDMVVKWKEYTLHEDAADCEVSGSCAVIQLSTTNVFESSMSLRVTLLDSVPDVLNDCDLDGTPEGTDDCNGNLIPDVVIRATSTAEPAGEIVILDQDGPAFQYIGEFTVSTLLDSPGVLFVAPDGSVNPSVTVTYLDNDFDPGPAVTPCPNDVDPAKHGLVRASSVVFVDGTCEIVLVDTLIEDNGDGDAYADTEETIDMRVCFVNHCGKDLHNCTARLSSRSPEVDCVIDSAMDVGDIAKAAGPGNDTVCSTDSFRWRVADVSRVDVEDDFAAHFDVTMTCDEFDALSSVQSVSVVLDLDIDVMGQSPTAWIEGFESGTLGKFEPENLDAGIPGANNTEGHINGDGWRCQYNDPDWINANGYAHPVSEDCFPGTTPESADAIYWQVDGTASGSPDGGRAKSGEHSMYFGIYLDEVKLFTTPTSVVESVRTTDPINLGAGDPQLSFWHQVSMVDGRATDAPCWAADSPGVVQIKTIDGADQDTSFWTRLEPNQNTYQHRGFDNYLNCLVDPVDDGSTEDDFFDPTDPERRLGPSSTCFPNYSYTCQGETSLPFDVDNTCYGDGFCLNPAGLGVPPTAADAPELGVGTWVETKVDLAEYRGRRIKLRYLVTALKLPWVDWEAAFFPDFNPDPRDDGWWIDDITVSESLASPAEFVVDDKLLQGCAGNPALGCFSAADCIEAGTTGPCNLPAPACGPTCTPIAVDVVTDPDQTGGALDELLSSPGQAILFNAAASSGTCLDGLLLYRFSVDGGAELRGWSDNPVFVAAPERSIDYLVEVGCSTDASCNAAAVVDVDVDCPSSGSFMGPFPESIFAQPNKTDFVWGETLEFDQFSGDVAEVSAFAGTLSSGTGEFFSDTSTPLSGQGVYYVVRRSGEFCNDTGLWTSGGIGEAGGPGSRDAGGLP